MPLSASSAPPPTPPSGTPPLLHVLPQLPAKPRPHKSVVLIPCLRWHDAHFQEQPNSEQACDSDNRGMPQINDQGCVPDENGFA